MGPIKKLQEPEQEFWQLTNDTLIPSAAVRAAWASYCPWEESNAPSVTGTLTWLGAAAQHANGVWLRERYVLDGAPTSLLPADLHAADIAARSTPFPRCVESCQKLLLGLYPPEHRPPAGSAASLTPIATHTRGEEPMYGAWFSDADSCPRILQVLHKAMAQRWQSSPSGHSWHFSVSSGLHNIIIESPVRREKMYFCLHSQSWCKHSGSCRHGLLLAPAA